MQGPRMKPCGKPVMMSGWLEELPSTRTFEEQSLMFMQIYLSLYIYQLQ